MFVAWDSDCCVFWTVKALLTCYFHHFIPRHFRMREYNLVSCTSGVSTLRCPIPQGVPNGDIFRWERSNRFKFVKYVEGSCSYWFVLFVNFYVIRYGDTAWQSKCTFPAQFVPMISINLKPFNVQGGGCLNHWRELGDITYRIWIWGGLGAPAWGCRRLETLGVLDLVTSVPHLCKTPDGFLVWRWCGVGWWWWQVDGVGGSGDMAIWVLCYKHKSTRVKKSCGTFHIECYI